MNSTVGNLNDVVGAVKDQKGTIGKLGLRSRAYDSIKGLADKGNALLGDVREGKGRSANSPPTTRCSRI